MSQRTGVLVPAIAAALLLLQSSARAQVSAGARTMATEAVVESRLVTLSGNTRPEAVAANDRGPVADTLPMQHLWLQLKRSPEQQAELDKFTEELHDASSPNYHQWITAKQFGEQFGMAQQDVSTVTAWLESRDFTVNHVYPNLVVDFSGTAGQVREAFHTAIHKLSVNGAAHIGNMSDPQIPAALGPVVTGLVSLNNFKPHAMNRPKPSYTVNSTFQLLAPADLATIYSFNPAFAAGYSGQGETIVVVEDTDLYSNDDWYYFRTALGLAKQFPEGKLVISHPGIGDGGTCGDPGVNGNDFEAIVDAEWGSAAAPSATIVVAACADTDANFGGYIALENILTGGGGLPNVVSISYAESETQNGASGNAYVNELYSLAVTEGVSIFVAAGDWGAAGSNEDQAYSTYGIGANGLGSTPNNVIVGGTDFADSYFGENSKFWNAKNGRYYGSALSYIPEIPWNDSCASVLIATVEGYATTYGTGGFCNSATGVKYFLDTAAGSGAPSACATGSPANSYAVGGTCVGYPKPSWQKGLVGVPSDGVRDTPDVALFAANGIWGHYYAVCYSDPVTGRYGRSCYGQPDTWAGVGGTSVATPIMAGIQALADQYTNSRWGNPNTVYYSLAKSEYGSSGSKACNSDSAGGPDAGCIFHDVTLGDMDVPCAAGTPDCYAPSGKYGVLSTSDTAYKPAYGTNTGWDFATGIGTVNAWNLIQSFPVSSKKAVLSAGTGNGSEGGK